MSTLTDAALARLEALVDRGRYFTDAESLSHCAIDGVAPHAGVQATTVEQVGEIVSFAAAEGLAIIPIGSGAQLGIGAPPARYDIALKICLDRILAFDPRDLTLSVEAGIPLNSLSARLRESRQFVPLDAHAGGSATVGGILAMNSSGALRNAYGTARDFVLGLEFVTGEGVRTKSGGRVVKSVAGYDIHKLMIGSLGTLGIITSANFRTFPLPPVQATFIATFQDAAGALQLRRAIAESRLQPRALDIVSPEAARFLKHADLSRTESLAVPELNWEEIRAELGETRAAEYRRQHREAVAAVRKVLPRAEAAGFSETAWSLVVAAGGNDSVVERHCRELETLAAAAGALSFREAKPDDPATAPDSLDGCEEWRWIRAFPDCVLQFDPVSAIFKLAVPPAAFGATLDGAKQIATRHELSSAALLRAPGLIYLALAPGNAAAGAINRLAAAGEELFTATAQAGGTAVIEFCPAELKRKMSVWGPPRTDLALMKNLKKEFDPRGILSPGRFYGGI